jgi:hypothetical protein
VLGGLLCVLAAGPAALERVAATEESEAARREKAFASLPGQAAMRRATNFCAVAVADSKAERAWSGRLPLMALA